jgi:PilZ domain
MPRIGRRLVRCWQPPQYAKGRAFRRRSPGSAIHASRRNPEIGRWRNDAPMACSWQMPPPRAEWFQAQALYCIGLALRAKDLWTKSHYVLEAERWLHLAERQADHLVRTEYRGVERRINPRHLSRIPGAIMLDRSPLVDCTVGDFSPAGAGLRLPDTVFLLAEFDLTFNYATNHVTHRCITVWRHTGRMGVKFKSAVLNDGHACSG